MASELANIQWRNVLLRTTEDKEAGRIAVAQGVSSELVGVDGGLHGGLRPLSGFKTFYELDFYAHPLHDETSVVNWFKPVNFRIGSNGYGFGVVYRAVRSRALYQESSSAGPTPSSSQSTAGTGSHSFSTGADLGSSTSSGNAYSSPGLADVFIDFWSSITDSPSAFGYKGEIMIEGVSITAQMDVVTFGRLIYVFVEGRDPMLFYVDAVQAVAYVTSQSSSSMFGTSGLSTSSGTSGNAASYQLKKLGRQSAGPFPGPGRQPTLVSPNNSQGLGNLQLPTDIVLFKRPAVGQITITTTSPQNSGLFSSDFGEGSASDQGWGSSSFRSDTNAGGGTGSSTFTDVTSSAGSNLTQLTSSSSRSSHSGSASTSSSASSSADTHSGGATPYSDPTSSCSGTLVTSSLSSNAEKIIAGFTIITPLPTFTGSVFAQGLLDRPIHQGIGVRVYDTVNPAIGGGQLTHAHIVHPTQAEIYFCSLEEYINNPAVLDTPIGVVTTSYTGLGRIVEDGAIYVTPHKVINIKPGTTYLWGMRVFNASTPCGFVIGNMDEPIAGPTDVPDLITEIDFAHRIGYIYKYRTAAGVEQSSASSEDPQLGEGKFAANRFEPGDYSFGYYLYDSKTGRRSAYSEVAQARKELFTQGVTSSASSVDDDAAVDFVVMELGYDPTKFDQAYIFRSVKVQDAGGTFVASIQHLDSVINLRDYETNRNLAGNIWDPAFTSYKHIAYWYKLEDKQLAVQDVYIDKYTFDEAMPKGGAAIMYRGTMLVSKIRDTVLKSTVDEARQDDGIRGLGEMRYSSLTGIGPELFPPSHKFVPAAPSNEIIRFALTGNNVIGFGRDRLYHIRKEGIYISDPQEIHEGYGIINPEAVDAVGSLLYYLTPKGLKAISSLGELDDVKSLDSLLIRDWVGQLGDASITFDPSVGALFLLNPTAQKMAVLWFNTGMITEIHDTPFTLGKMGFWPETFTDYRSTLVQRAMFLQNPPKDSPAEVINGFKPRLMMLDYTRSKVISGATTGNGSPRLTTLDFGGDTRTTLNAVASTAAGYLVTVASIPQSGVEGAYIYVTDSPNNESLIGTRAQIKKRIGSHGLLLSSATGAEFFGLVGISSSDNVRVAISPVVFRWVGPQLTAKSEEGQEFLGQDMHRIKQAEALGAFFTDVSGPAVGDEISSSSSGLGDTHNDAKYQALLYRGTSTNPIARAWPRDHNGAIIASIEENETTHWAGFGDTSHQGRFGVMGATLSPGVQVICPDLDFRLVSTITEGKMLSTERSKRFPMTQ